MLYSPQVRISSTGRARADNSRKLASLLRADTTEQTRITSDDLSLAYVGFQYNPKFPALEQAARDAAWTPDFPAVSGRIAYCNGNFVREADTSVSYRRGRRLVTEWHALAGVACY